MYGLEIYRFETGFAALHGPAGHPKPRCHGNQNNTYLVCHIKIGFGLTDRHALKWKLIALLSASPTA